MGKEVWQILGNILKHIFDPHLGSEFTGKDLAEILDVTSLCEGQCSVPEMSSHLKIVRQTCESDIQVRHAVCQQPCSQVWLNLNARVCPPAPSCPPPPQLPKRRRRLPPNGPTRRYSLYNTQPSVPVQSPSVVQYAGAVCTTLRAGTELSRHGTGLSHHPQHPYLLQVETLIAHC